ncbi:MAG: hypothetical protein JW965_01230, partial [Bacteroidales bacterium]|nr:hypothetical protein [Bacteroidales bacterium]
MVTLSGYSQDAGPDQEVCGLTTTLAAEDPSPDTGVWSVDGTPPGTVSFDDATLYNTDVDVSAYGEYTFMWTVGGNSDIVDIIFNPDASITHTGGSNNQTVCINTPITNITYSIGGSGNDASATGLPAGVQGTYNAGVFTISGTPTVSGNFNYNVIATGPCAPATAVGAITVNPNATITLTSGNNTQTVCINTAITNITYTIGGSGNDASVDGLPDGLNGVYSSGIFTISGTPTESGTFEYTVTATGLCRNATAGGTLTVNPDATIIHTGGNNNQTRCINSPITNITYTIGGSGNNASVTGLPEGVDGTYSSGVFTISGTPEETGVFNFAVTATGPCNPAVANGTITVSPDNTITLSSAAGTDNQEVCINTGIASITYTTTGATGANITGLPAGVNGGWEADQVTISGTPT